MTNPATTPVEQPIAQKIAQQIADELGVRAQQVAAAVELIDGGATVPFIARYRKEATGGLDDTQLRTLRRPPALSARARGSARRHSRVDPRAGQARRRARGGDPSRRQQEPARGHLPAVPAEAAYQGGDCQGGGPRAARRSPALASRERPARRGGAVRRYREERRRMPPRPSTAPAPSWSERFGEDADLIGSLREEMWSAGRLVSKVREGKQEAGAKFSDYFDFTEKLAKVPSHRTLALFRAEKGGDPRHLDDRPRGQAVPRTRPARMPRPIRTSCASCTASASPITSGRPGDKWLIETARWAWRTKIQLHLGIDLRARLWGAAEREEAVRVFAANLRDLLLCRAGRARAPPWASIPACAPA